MFQQAIDRQDRTLQSRRTLQLYWNHWRYSLYHRNTPTTGQGLIAPAMTCLVGLHSIEATHPAGHNNETPRTTPRRRKQTSHCDSLRIAPGHSRLDPRLPTTDINHRLLGMGTVSPVYPIWQSTGLFFGLLLPLPFMYTSVHLVVHANRCEALGNCIVASIKKVFVFSLYSLFYAIYPKTTETLLLYFVAYIPQEYLPFTFKPFHHGPYQDPQALYHQDSCAESY